MRLGQVALCALATTGCNLAFGLDIATDARPIDVQPIDVAADGAPASIVGCADGTREGFDDIAIYPKVAACGGAWNIPGLAGPAAVGCDPNNGLTQCAAANVCSSGWRICTGVADVAPRFDACHLTAAGFFTTAQRSSGNKMCTSLGSNDLFGCYSPPVAGLAPDPGCAPLDATANDGCSGVGAPWNCPSGSFERDQVTKDAGPGGVLCCHD